MFPFFSLSAVGARRTGLSTWRTTAETPTFTVRPRLGRPRYGVLFLAAADGPLKPRLEVDYGPGPAPEVHAVGHNGLGIYAIDLIGNPDVREIRLVVPSLARRLGVWARGASSRHALQRMIARSIERTMAGKGPPPVFEVVGAGAERHTIAVPAKRRFKGNGQHFVRMLTMAAMTPVERGTLAAGDGAPPLSFVVPVYNTATRYLDDLYASFRAQPTGTAELVLTDDGSTSQETRAWLAAHATAPFVTVVTGRENGGIAAATNAGIAASRGAWVGLVDHDDALSPYAVPRILEALRQHPDAAFLYTDELITNEALKPVHYHLKPAYDPVLLSGVNYINHLSLYRRDRLLALGGLRQGYEGSQDYDLLLRYLSGLQRHEILHLPYPAYLWRRHAQSFSTTALDQALANARRALGEQYGSAEAPVPVEGALAPTQHRVRFDMAVKTWPKVSIIVPSRDSYDLIARLLEDLATRTDYPDCEIIVVDNGTTDARVLALYERARAQLPGFRVEITPEAFNFSRQVNRGIRLSTGEHILLLNNDIEVMEPQWLREMVSCLAYPGTGIVGVRLLYPDRTLQHAGVIVGLADLAGHWYHAKPEAFAGMMGRLNVRQSLSAVTAACMLISRSCLDAVGAFDEEAFAVAYNDVDYCLRAVKQGYRIVWTPFATLIHHESASRGSDELPANRARFAREKVALRERHGTDKFSDPAFSPWFDRGHSEPRLILLDRLPEAR